MKTTTTFLASISLALLLALACINATAQTTDSNTQNVLYAAYKSNSLTLWKQGVAQLAAAYANAPDDEDLLLH